MVVNNWSSHLGIHKQLNTCWSIPRSQTVFIHFKICRRSAESGNYETFVAVHCYHLQFIKPPIRTNKHDESQSTPAFAVTFSCFWQLFRIFTPVSVFLCIQQMPSIVLLSYPLIESFCRTHWYFISQQFYNTLCMIVYMMKNVIYLLFITFIYYIKLN